MARTSTNLRNRHVENVNLVTPPVVEPWEGAARSLFGSVARFKVGVWIACRSAHAFYPAMAAEEIGYETALLNPSIYQRFEDLGMIRLKADNNNARCKWYERQDHSYWDIFRVAAKVFQTGDIIGNRWDEQFKTTLLGIRDKLDATLTGEEAS
jgi:hypothetical protein